MEMHAPEPPQAANELKPLKPAPVVAMPAATPTSMPAAMPAAAMATPAKKPPVVPIAIVAVLVIGGAVAYFAMRKPKPATPVAAKPAVVQTQTTATSIAATSTAPILGTTAPTTTASAIDPSKVNEEVAKRMAAEKARLEQLARTQNQQTTTAAAARPVIAPPPQQVATQTVAPPPVVENRPVPVPQPPAPAPQPVAETRPAPQPEAPRTQAGDLVPAGTPGLTPAHITRLAQATYPPIARMQHVQGSVVVSALVSETGQVLETRVVSSPQTVLNEAAQQSIRRSTFSPGEKDGVRVKTWTNVRVDFKL
jgi:TonB family protein